MKKVFRIMAIAVLGVAMATSCAKSDEDQVKQAANDFLTAFNKLDFDGAKKYATPESAEQLDAYKSLVAMSGTSEAPKVTVEITGVEINGEEATAKYTSSEEGKAEKEEASLKLKKVDGKWLVNYQKEGFGGGDEATTTEETEEVSEEGAEATEATAEAAE